VDDSNKQQPEQQQAPHQSHHHKRKHSSKKKWLIIGAIVIVLFIGGGITGWMFMSSQQPAPASSLTEEQFDQTISDAQTLANNGDTNGAIAAYDNAVKATNDAYQKSVITLEKAVMYLNEKNYEQALVIAKQAEVINVNFEVVKIIAQIYDEKGDKKNAITYYKKTIELIDKNDPMASDDAEYYQGLITDLGGTK